ncbi:hypothetical protein EW145_g7246 [Phellinidium pouzarii]|uniref:tRNA-specific adenosine deaminase 1 n=1 Tax=Phellinidium pouzarii TaxID=167371 RepID=A0A4S4KM24_9AGAM|nr:hypothetical protein EW145_g7246 [Phellinidium pouzarii]
MAALKDSAPPAALPPGTATRGRNNYALFGVLRTKPGRADSPPTLCMSCSDKIASWSVIGVQGALASSMFAPIYVCSVVISDVPEEMREVVREDCERAFYRRLEGIKNLPEGFRLSKPDVQFTSTDFVLSRTALHALHPHSLPPPSSNEYTTYHRAKRSDVAFQLARSALKGPDGPFAGWVISGEPWESFGVEGEIIIPDKQKQDHADDS